MAEYIERDKVIKELREAYEYDYPTASGDFDEYARQDVPNIIRSIPTADVQPVKRGHWIDMGDHEQCSECNATRLKEFQSYYGKVTRWEKTNYCPYCGADMRGEDNG